MNYGYDIEVYPNVFTFCCKRIETGDRWYFEISDRRNDLSEMITFLYALRDSGASMVGFNNLGYDYPIIHYILERMTVWSQLAASAITAYIYEKSKSIIDSGHWFDNAIWQPMIRQIDLIQIHALNTVQRFTSLKMLEFNMRMIDVGDLPFEPGTFLTVEEIPILAEYNEYDVDATIKFYHHSVELIKIRDELTELYGKDFTNFSDAKIGEEYLMIHMEKHTPGICYYYDEFNKRQPRQTFRESINLKDVIFPYIRFKTPEFKQIKSYFSNQTITQTKNKGGFESIINGFKLVVGLGGIHGSVQARSIHSDNDYIIIDIDVKGFYPSLAIVNKISPEHLGNAFCDVYRTMYEQRKNYAKKTAMNNMLKLAGNAGYGKSNSEFSALYDPKYTMTVTVNGQLLLCLFIESLFEIPNLTMIQANTDGVTLRVPRVLSSMVDKACREWESFTGLVLEDVNYKSMYIRDVNNYIGVFEDGSVKQTGAYVTKLPQDQTPLAWHKNHSAMIVPKAANAVLIDGVDLVEYITSPERDIMDFMLRTKIPRKCKLMLVDGEGVEHEQQRVTRYYVAHVGGSLVKISPVNDKYIEGTFKKKNGVSEHDYAVADNTIWNPDIHTGNKSLNKIGRTGIDVGWKVEICNDLRSMNPSNLNHAYYIAETRKLIERIL